VTSYRLHDKEQTGQHLRASADALNKRLESESDRSGRAVMGQFTTPSEAASSIVEILDLTDASQYRIVDAGAGAGALMLSLVAQAIETGVTARLVIDMVERDDAALRLLDEAVGVARAAGELHGVELDLNIIDADFLDVGAWVQRPYDIAVMNPPYSKLGQHAAARTMVHRNTGVECPNLYAAFMATALIVLVDGGQLAAITPRSFANGRYFLPLRRFLAGGSAFRHVVLFDRRDRIFRSSSVLQETVIFRLDKSATPDAHGVVVETRVDHQTPAHDIHEVPQSMIVSLEDPDRFINLPGNTEVMAVAARVRSYNETLGSLGLSVSTGPVVGFRATEYLTTAEDPAAVPLIYPNNVQPEGVCWPVKRAKAQGYVRTAESARRLFPNGHYVVVKRFTSKEERRRVVAAVYEPIDGFEEVAFENHVNVIHCNREPIPRGVAEEIADYLNSDDVDVYFRMFSGNTQVNATDLRRLHVPLTAPLSREPVPGHNEGNGSLFGHEVAGW